MTVTLDSLAAAKDLGLRLKEAGIQDAFTALTRGLEFGVDRDHFKAVMDLTGAVVRFRHDGAWDDWRGYLEHDEVTYCARFKARDLPEIGYEVPTQTTVPVKIQAAVVAS